MRLSFAQARKLGLVQKADKRPVTQATRRLRLVPPPRPRPAPAGTVRLVLHTRPVPKERHRRDPERGHMYTPRRTAKFAALVRRCGEDAMRGYGPFPGPVRATITFYFAVPKSWRTEWREAALRGEILPTMRPDLDNTLKNALDALNGVVYFDDAQICAEHIEKYFAAEPRIELAFEAIAARGSSQLRRAA